jgi:hypothetical protein
LGLRFETPQEESQQSQPKRESAAFHSTWIGNQVKAALLVGVELTSLAMMCYRRRQKEEEVEKGFSTKSNLHVRESLCHSLWDTPITVL